MLRTIVNINTRRSFHFTAIAREEWTKASLRRMKKPELVKLAKENNLKLSGTKNDIIIQLLTHQTAKIVGVETPSSLAIPKTKPPPAFGSLDVDSYSEESDDLDLDTAWTNAFEMKVAQRGSRKPMADVHDHFTSGSKELSLNKQIKPSDLLQSEDTTKPIPTSVCSEKAASFEPKKIDVSDEVEGMDAQWVEAFDLKVGSRGARRELIDTLSPTTPPSASPLEGLEFITIDKQKNNEVNDDSVHYEPKLEHTEKKSEHVEKHSEKHTEKHTEKHGKEHSHDDNKHNNKQNNSKEHTHNESKHNTKKEHSHNESKNDIKVEKSNSHENTKENEKLKENKKKENNSNEDHKDTTDSSNREKLINTTLGSSMILWYIGGGEGISKIWHFLTSSS